MISRRYILAGLVIAVVVLLGFYFRPASQLIGYDKDGNGLWDDIDEQIMINYKNPLLQKGASQLALAIQESLLHPENAKSTQRLAEKAHSCLAFLYSKIDPAKALEAYKVRDLVVTNREREMKWIRFSVNLSGRILELLPEDRSNCQFDTSGL